MLGLLYVGFLELGDVAVLGEVDDHPREDGVPTEVIDGLDGVLTDVQFQGDPDQGVLGLHLVLQVLRLLLLLLKDFVIEGVGRGEFLLHFSPLGLIAHLGDILVGVDLEGYLIILVEVGGFGG